MILKVKAIKEGWILIDGIKHIAYGHSSDERYKVVKEEDRTTTWRRLRNSKIGESVLVFPNWLIVGINAITNEGELVKEAFVNWAELTMTQDNEQKLVVWDMEGYICNDNGDTMETVSY